MRFWIILVSLLLIPPAQAQAPREAGRLALVAASQNRWAEAEVAAERADPLIRRMVLWLRLQSRTGPYSGAEFVQFAESAADWPLMDPIGRNAEATLRNDGDDALALRWFATRPARTVAGGWRHADALARAGRDREATEAARRAWADSAADAVEEPFFLERHAARLTTAEHWSRFNRLAYARDFAGAGRVLPYLDQGRAAVAQLRLNYAQGGSPDQNASLAARDPGATLERARALRIANRDSEAAAAFAAGAPGEVTAEAGRAIWNERQLQARRALRLNDPRTAYALAAGHGQPVPGEVRQEAEFLAGFVALRFLNDPARAARHFTMVGEDSRSAITQARSHYWRGRAMSGTAARDAYTQAAAYPVAYYGQLASLALGEAPDRIAARLRAIAQPGYTQAQANAFGNREIARIIPLLAEMGEGRRARLFLLRMEELSTQPWERSLLMQLALRSGRPENPVWVARRAGAAGAMLVPDGWPTPYPTGGLPVEPALVNAITRQESNFDTEAVSSANARGLMQLLPATAQQVARRLGTPYQLGLLQGDPAFNLRLGSAYLAQMMERFGGAWPYAIAAYNAGPGRVDEWLQSNGDARGGNPQMLDWIEMIPFTETRNYVQRVTENVVVYRALTGVAAPHPLAPYLR